MTLSDILMIEYVSNNVVKDDTLVYIQEGSNIVARGKWFQDNILRYSAHEVLNFQVNLETHTLRVKVRGDK